MAAFDTENKRRAVLTAFGIGTFPDADGSIDLDDRPAAALVSYPRSLYPTPPRMRLSQCEGASRPGHMEVQDCFAFDMDCLYCLPSGGVSPNPECVIRVPFYNDRDICKGANDPLPAAVFRPNVIGTELLAMPQFRLFYPASSTDAEGSSAAFIAGDMSDDDNNVVQTWRYLLRTSTPMEIDPCGLVIYDTAPTPPPIWLCRWFEYGGISSWQMHCNVPVVTDEFKPNDDQLQHREFFATIHSPSGQPYFLRFSQGPAKCFDFENHFCLSDTGCLNDERWDCLGSTGTEGTRRVRATDWLWAAFVGVSFNVSDTDAGQAFPHKNPADVTIKNHALYTMAAYTDRLDQPDPPHNSSGQYNRGNLSRWLHIEEFAENIPEDRPAYPVVTVYDSEGIGATYEGDGTAVAVTAREWITKVELPCHLTLYVVSIDAYLHVEARLFGNETRRRTYGNISVVLTLRPKLLDDAYTIAEAAGLQFMEPDDPFDLRLENKAQLGTEHPHQVLLLSGPSGERVPQKVSWRGLKADYPYSRGAHEYSLLCETTPGNTCCDFLRALDDITLFGELNDHSEELESDDSDADNLPQVIEKPQRYLGAVSFGVPGLDGSDGLASVGCRCI